MISLLRGWSLKAPHVVAAIRARLSLGAISGRPQLPVTVANLLGRGLIGEDEVWAAVDGYLADPTVRPHRFSSGHVLDVAAIAIPTRGIRNVLAAPSLTDALRREVIRTMVILAEPTVS